MARIIRVAVVGCGSRGMYSYAPYVRDFENATIVAAAEPVRERRERFARIHGLTPEQCYETAEDFFEQDRLADVAFICTQDRQHYRHTINALRKGYDVLLEKPISHQPGHCLAIAEEARRLGRVVVVCHVLRYTPFYQKIKELISERTIGDIVSLHQFENVGWWHYAHSFVRGLWSNSDEASPMILAKSCHDLDIILWLMDRDCLRVSSFGSLMHFTKAHAPAGSTLRCGDGCTVLKECPYNALRIYKADLPEMEDEIREWPLSAVTLDPTRESLKEALKNGPYGRCVYHCDNNVVDHQVVNMEFAGGATASLTMCGFTSEMTRELKVMGTHGEITGHMDRNIITVRQFGQNDEVIDVTQLATDLSGHGGGENKMLRDLFRLTEGENPHTALTSVAQSVQSHLMAFAAERSRLANGCVVELN